MCSSIKTVFAVKLKLLPSPKYPNEKVKPLFNGGQDYELIKTHESTNKKNIHNRDKTLMGWTFWTIKILTPLKEGILSAALMAACGYQDKHLKFPWVTLSKIKDPENTEK